MPNIRICTKVTQKTIQQVDAMLTNQHGMPQAAWGSQKLDSAAQENETVVVQQLAAPVGGKRSKRGSVRALSKDSMPTPDHCVEPKATCGIKLTCAVC